LLSALVELGLIYQDAGDRRSTSVVDEAVSIVGRLPRSPALVDALGELSVARMIGGEYQGSIDTADTALELARELGLPRPTRALVARGGSRCTLGDEGGLADGREALESDVASGAGYRAGIAYNNHAIDTFLFDGPRAALAILDAGETFALQRGLTRALNAIRCSKAGYLAEAGRLDETIRVASALITEVAASDAFYEFEATAYRAFALNEQGHGTDSEELLVAALSGGFGEDTYIAGAAVLAAIRGGAGDSEGVRVVLGQMLARDGLGDSTELAQRLPTLVRAALRNEGLELAGDLVALVEPNVPLRRLALLSSRALLAEAQGNFADAGALFGEAVTAWERVGAALEQAYALLGQGRCLVAVGDDGADRPLREGRALFDGMGARPRVDECDTLIARASKLSS
jgi:hypothetical protein